MGLLFLVFALLSFAASSTVFSVTWNGNKIVAGILDTASGNFSALGIMGVLSDTIGAIGIGTYDRRTGVLYASVNQSQIVRAQVLPSFQALPPINLDGTLSSMSFDETEGKLVLEIGSSGYGATFRFSLVPPNLTTFLCLQMYRSV